MADNGHITYCTVSDILAAYYHEGRQLGDDDKPETKFDRIGWIIVALCNTIRDEPDKQAIRRKLWEVQDEIEKSSGLADVAPVDRGE